MSEFKREERYIVIKRKDLNTAPFAALHTFLEHLQALDGLLPARQFLVIESDWPEYEPAWAMIEARMTRSAPQPPALGGDLPWHGWNTGSGSMEPGADENWLHRDEVAPLLAENAALRKTTETSDANIFRQSLQISNLKAERDTLLAEMERVTAYANKRDQFVKELQDSVHLMTAERDTLKADLASAKADKESYAQNAIDLREQVDTFKAQRNELIQLLDLVRDDEGTHYTAELNQRIKKALNPEDQAAPVTEAPREARHQCQECFGLGTKPTRLPGEGETDYRNRCKAAPAAKGGAQ